MLNVNTVINPDDYVGTVRRTLKRAVRKQLRGAEAVAAYAQCRKIAGGTVVRRPPRRRHRAAIPGWRIRHPRGQG